MVVELLPGSRAQLWASARLACECLCWIQAQRIYLLRV